MVSDSSSVLGVLSERIRITGYIHELGTNTELVGNIYIYIYWDSGTGVQDPLHQFTRGDGADGDMVQEGRGDVGVLCLFIYASSNFVCNVTGRVNQAR